MKEYLTLINDEDFSGSLVEEPQSKYGFKYADYLTWNFKESIKLIKGKVFKMSPAPLFTHQAIVGNVYIYLANRIKHDRCKIFFRQ